MDMDIRNEYYEEMAEKVDGIMRRLTDGYRRDGGCFRTADEANPTFFGTLLVDPAQPQLAYMETLPTPVPAERRSEMIFALNAVNSCTLFNKFYLKDFPTADGRQEFVVEENSLFCPGGRVTDTDVSFLLASGMQDLAMYSAGLRGIADGSVSAADFVNSVTRED